MSSIKLSDLTPAMQAQIAGKLAAENKLHAERTTMDGQSFDSRKEARRYLELAMRQKAGEISDLRRQVKYVLIPAQRDDNGKLIERECAYYADFVYIDRNTGAEVVEDVKGYKNPSTAAYGKYIIKRKLMLWVHGVRISET